MVTDNQLERINAALIGRYSIERLLGRGGMAGVYLARDQKHDRSVAIKVMRSDLSEMMGPDRFLREIQIAAGLQHPHVVALYDSGEADGLLFYVMPFIEGETLRQRLLHGPLGLTDSLTITEEIAGALGYAHGQGIVHRDIKPENILFSDGHAMVADFGIARAVSTAVGGNLTKTGFPIGTPGYMSPEQAAGASDPGPGTDVFSLGCVCYEMLVGAVPGYWVRPDETEKGVFLRASPPHRARLDMVPGSVEHVLVKAMAMDVTDRFETPAEFAEALFKPSDKKRSFAETDVREIVRKAAEREASEVTDSAMTMGTIKELAREAGIPAKHVEAVVREMDGDAASPAPSKNPPRFFGLLAGNQLECTVSGEIPSEEMDYLIDEVRRDIGSLGRLERGLGRSLSWTSTHANKEGKPQTTVHVVSRSGKTNIRIEEDETQAYAVGALGVFVVTIMGVPLVSLGVDPSILGVGALVGAGATVKAASWLHKKRKGRLSALLDRLAMIVEDAVKR